MYLVLQAPLAKVQNVNCWHKKAKRLHGKWAAEKTPKHQIDVRNKKGKSDHTLLGNPIYIKKNINNYLQVERPYNWPIITVEVS